MAYRWKNDLRECDVTPEPVWLDRRAVIAGAAGLGLLGASGAGSCEAPALAE